MLSVAEALARVLNDFQPLSSEFVSVENVVGRVLAESISSTLDLPPFVNSSMDGYAVRADDVRAASTRAPISLRVIGDIPAGTNPTLVIEKGNAARIMTGAKLPRGADAVVPVEATDNAQAAIGGVTPDHVSIFESVQAGAYIRSIGEDVRAGDIIFKAGTITRPYDVGALAALGVRRVSVVRRPRVAIFSTGDELVSVDQTPGPGQIRDINTHALSALIKKYGGESLMLGILRDDVNVVHRALMEAVTQKADVIISSAGVSVGAYDVVKSAVERDGSLNFWKVKMRPGKPFAYGKVRGVPFFGLPGNPVSAIVGFEIFVRPALLKLGGYARVEKPILNVVVNETLHSDGRETYLRAIVTRDGEHYAARSAGGQGSNIVSALTRANALLIIPADVTEVKAGERLKAWMLDWSEDAYL
ncbi:MAG: molybdopterin molybdotransferase MoeA [Chloroflexi bacterium]|nr:molybdopterin molybdotransferase MoeA [Chloroflexota bacterium]MBI5079944.1 molybdopterin molybdotransferase MoeA [Chloroflexota bacterium]MBI5713176.1 molybdopterin molybdotransferase MoeA [Chloroflexota bacterium]